jgi:hypothetical protein
MDSTSNERPIVDDAGDTMHIAGVAARAAAKVPSDLMIIRPLRSQQKHRIQIVAKRRPKIAPHVVKDLVRKVIKILDGIYRFAGVVPIEQVHQHFAETPS